MARFLRFIFHILLICYIAVVLALVIPPLVGFTTATVLEGASSNQPVGTVDYAKRTPLEQITVGDRILVTANDNVNVYTVQSVDLESSAVTVANTENQEIPVRSYVYKLILAVPVIGFMVIALQSMEGIIVLAMIAVLLLLLCILSNVWVKKKKEKNRRRRELEAERRAAEKAKAASEEKAAAKASAASAPEQSADARAEAYFAARQAEMNRPAPDEEYEDFPPKPVAKPAAPVSASKMSEAQPKPMAAKPEAETEYFDDDEDDDNTDFWLHDDVDDDDLYEGLNNRAASESLMATARLFAINRAAQAKEKMASGGTTREAVDQTKVVLPAAIVQAAEAKAAGDPAGEKNLKVKNNPVKELTVDKVVNLKELKELDADTQQIVLTINLKIVSD